MRIEHVAMYVNNLEAAKAFFIKYFDAVCGDIYRNCKTGFSSYFLSFDSGARLEIMNKPEISNELKNPCDTGYIHIAFSLGSREKVNSLTETLAKDGFKIISGPRVTGDGYYESQIEIFEGNLIELTV